jgi:hypothetical protein
MLAITVVNELLSCLVENGANRLLRALGGPHHVPHGNEDFIWF